MANRTLFSATLLSVGGLCLAVTILAASWIDTSSVHENTALNQAAVQAALQGKAITEWTQHFSIVSPKLLWTSFAIGAMLILGGLIIGLRSLSVSRTSS
jgi:hypothetical protein